MENTEPTDKSLSQAQPARRPRWAQLLSDFFSPLLIPTYATALAMWVTPLRSVPESNRLIVTILVGVITGLIPLLAIAVLIRTGKVSDRALSRRDQRAMPMVIGVACYFGAALFVGSLGAPLWLRMFFWGAGVATIIAMLITCKWKISAHTTAIGGLVGMMMWFATSGLADVNVMIMLSVGIVLAGAMASARLALNRHTLAQTLAGLALGFACCFTAMSI